MTKNVRTREMIAAEAAQLKKSTHICIDRDWCNTGGETGCGTLDTKLAALRLAWKAAPSDWRTAVEYTTLANGIVIKVHYDFKRRSLGAVAYFLGSVLRREWNTKFTTHAEYTADMVKFYEGHTLEDLLDN